MIKRITISHIIVFFLQSWAVHAQSNSPQTRDVSSNHVLVALVCIILFAACFSIFLRHCSNTDLAVAGGRVLTSAAINCPSSSPQGIDPKFLNTFPILIYSAVKFEVAPNECSVCLNEFDQQDILRLLPKCNHLFHTQCIDAWLASHVTCPVCRTCLNAVEERGSEVVIVITDEVNSQRMVDESYESRTEGNSGNVIRSLGRCHSTGHSMGFSEIGGKDMEKYSVRNLEDVMKQIKSSHGGMRRSASSDVLHGRSPGEQKSRDVLYITTKNWEL